MSYIDPVLKEKYRIQKILSEEAKDMQDYTRRAHDDVNRYFAERGWTPNYQSIETNRQSGDVAAIIEKVRSKNYETAVSDR